MARGTTLTRLLDMLRAEIKASLNPAHNRQVRDTQVNALQQAQTELWEDYDWPFLNIERTVQLNAGVYLYDPPDDVVIDGIKSIEVRWGGDWVPLTEGIDREQYAAYDTLLDERSWPVERWRIAESEKIEVWPVPSDTGTVSDYEGYIKFNAKKPLNSLVDDSDRCTLDDRAIVLYAATNFVTGEALREAKSKFQNRLGQIRANMAPRESFRMFGRQMAEGRKLHGPPRVHYRVNET